MNRIENLGIGNTNNITINNNVKSHLFKDIEKSLKEITDVFEAEDAIPHDVYEETYRPDGLS